MHCNYTLLGLNIYIKIVQTQLKVKPTEHEEKGWNTTGDFTEKYEIIQGISLHALRANSACGLIVLQPLLCQHHRHFT